MNILLQILSNVPGLKSELAKMFLSAQENSNSEDMETAETVPSSGLGKEMFNTF